MWKAAFGGRSERGSTVGVDDTASTASRRRRHRRSSNDDKSMVSSTSRRTDGDKDRDRKRHSRHESGVSYGSAPIPRLTESAVNAFNANDDDDDDIWEDEADLKSERRSEHKRSDSRERRRRKSSARSERSRSRERDSKSKKSSGRGERSRSRERDGWTRKSSSRTERSRSRDRDREDRDRKKRDDKSSRTERPNGKSRVSEIVDNADAVSVMPSTFSIDQYPHAINPSTVRFDEHTMSGALDSHVPNQFPGQNPSTYTKSDFEPNPHGAAADYYQDKGQSVKHQPGERAFTPNLAGSSFVAASSGSTKPTKPAKSTKQSSSSSSSVKPSKKSSRGISPPAQSSIIPAAAAAAAAIAGAQSSSRKSSRAVSPPAANHHMQARAFTQYEPSSISHNDYANSRPAASEFSVMPPSEYSAMPPSEYSAMPPSEFSAMPPSVISGLPQSTMSGQPPRPVRYNSEPPPTAGAASTYYESSELPPSVPAQSAGAAAAGLAAYGVSQHNQHSQQSEHHQHTQYTENTQHARYNDNSSRYGASQSQYGAQAPFTPERPGPYYQSAPNSVSTGMHHHHEHKGPISRLKDGFLNLLSSPEDVAKMEEYTEYIGVCKNCFDPRSSPYAGPRKHHYHPKKKDSFETLRRRSLERMQRRRSDESLRRTNSKVQKENRYYSSDRKSSSNAGYMAGGLAVAGAATAGAAMFNDRKNFDDTYSVKSGHRASSAVRRRGSQSSLESTRRRTSRGRVSSDRHDEFITVRTKDGRVENRKVHRSRSGSTGRKSNWIGSAAGGAALGAAGAAATSRHRRRSSPDQVSLRHDERRYRSRSSSRSHSPGLGEIFGFSEPRSRRSGKRSPFGSYQDSRKEQQRRKEKGGFFNFSNGSASSSESGMAFGDVNGSNLSRKSSGKRKVSKKSSDEKLKATLLGIGATAAALTAAQKLSKSPKAGPRPELGARRNVRVSQYGPDGRKSGPPSDEGEWVDELPSGESSDASGLAFDDGNGRRRLASRPSMDSVGSSSSSNDGLSAWGWRWGNKKQKKQKPTTHPEQQRQHSMSNIPVAGPLAAGMATGAAFDAYGRRVPSDIGLVDSTSTSQAPMQHIEPQPLSDVSSRHPSMPGAFEDPPLQQPQPITPFQPSFTQGSPEDPLRPTAGPSSKPPMRRSVSSPTRNSKGGFMGDAAFIGGAAVATAGIIASQNRKGSPGSVRFGLNGEQQEKFDREIRQEREKEDAERRRADRTRALKEEADRFAREEDEKRALAERKRRQQKEEERERQRQVEANQREEAYRREQARNAEEARRRGEEERQAEEEERQRFNDRQIREELERKQREREEKSRKKKDKSNNERSQDSSTSWKGPVAAGVAGALAGAVLDGALHKQGREDAKDKSRSRDATYSTQTFEPTNEHSGAPITDDDLVDPDFFKRRHSPADFRRYEELSNEKLDELTHEREDYYNMPAQSQKDFFMPKELLEKEAEGKERVADPYGDNEVDVYQTTGGEARHIYGNDFGRYGKAPVIHQNVPKLNVIAPTPPLSTAGSTKGDRSAPPSPLADLPEDNIGSKRANDAADVAPGADETTRHMPGGFEDSVYRDQQHPSTPDAQEAAWEPPLSKKDKKKRDKAGKRESEPVTPLEELLQDLSASRSVPFDAPQEDFTVPTSAKDKKKKGKKQTSTLDDEPVTSSVVEAEREPEPVITADPAVIEGEFAPLSKKDKKKKSKKGMSFDDSEPSTPAPESPRVDAYFVPDATQDRAFDPVAEGNKEAESFQPLSKKDKKKKGKKSLNLEDSEPSTPVNEIVEPEPEQVVEAIQAEPESAWEPPLSKKEQKKREKAAKMGLPLEDSQPSTPNNQRSMPDFEPEPVTEAVEPEADSTWEPPLSKKDKKKREKEAKGSVIAEEVGIATPLEEPTEPWSETREPEVEAVWEPPLSKKDKKKREKDAKNAFALDTSEPSTPLEEPTSRDIDPLVQDAEPAFEPPLSKKEKKKREKEAQRLSVTLGDSSSDTPANERSDPLLEQSRELDADPLISSQEVPAEPEWEPPLSKKDKKKREKEAQKQSESFNDPEPKAAVDDLGGVELEHEPAADAAWEPPLSKKDKKKREKESKRQSVSFEDPEPSATVDEFVEPEQSWDVDADAAWEAPLSKKEQKKREKEAKSFGFGDVAAAVMTTAGVAAIADAVSKPEEEDYSSGKKSKKNKKNSSSFDESPQSEESREMPGAWDESSSDAAKDFSAADRDIARIDTSSPSQELPADDFGSSDTKKSKKKKKRESGRFNEPATGSPLRSEIAYDDYLGDAGPTNDDAQSTGYGRGGQGPSYYDDDYPKTGSPRNMSPDDAKSTVSAPGLERRASSKSKSKRRSGVYEDAADFDDNRSIYSAATAAPALERRTSSKSKRRSGVYEDADFDDTRSIRSSATEPPSSSSKKEKKGGLFGLFSRKSSDGDKRDQSFLGDRVEDLPPLPLSQTSAISASAQEEQDHGAPASADAVDQAVTNDTLPEDAPPAGSVYTEAVPGGVNMDIWGDPIGDTPAQPDNGEDVWGDEEFADRPSLPREAMVDPTLDSMAAPAEGATPARTGGPMTNVEEDFDDWFGSTDPTPKAPLLIKGKKGKKAKKGKAAQAKSSAPSSPAPSSPVAETSKEELVASPVDVPAVSGTSEAEQTRDMSLEEAMSTEPAKDATETTQISEPVARSANAVEPASTAPLSDSHAVEHPEELFHDQFARRPSLTPRPLSSTAVPLRFRPIPSSPSYPKERSLSFGSPVESAPISPASVTGSNKKPRPRSSEFREVRPLYLVSRNSKLEDVEEQLPDLPDSKPSSRASSVQGSEDWHSAAEDMSPQPDLYMSPGSARKNLTIDLDQANQYRTEEEIMDTADQTTPKASDFPQTAFIAPKSSSKQVPQFYTWEDLAKDEEMHEAAARQAEGTVEPDAAPPADATSAEGLGIEQAEEDSSSAPAHKGKKDKRKNNGLAAAALLAGGAAAAMAIGGPDDAQTPTGAQEDKPIDQAVPATVDTPKDIPDDTATVLPAEAGEDFFASTTTKKSKKAKKNKKGQSAVDEPDQPAPVQPEPTTDVPAEGTAAEYYAATEEAMAKDAEAPAAESVSDTTAAPAAPAEVEATPAEDEWASLATSKKGKKGKKGKKQKVDAWAEPEPVQTPSAEAEIAAPSDAAVPEPSGAAVDDNNSDVAKSTVTPELKETADDNVAGPAPETDAVSVDKPSASVDFAAEAASEKDAAASSSRGWFSWPWGAKKGAEEGLEVDPVTMQAREMPAEAKEPGAEILNAKTLTESPAQDKTADAGVSDAQDTIAATDPSDDDKYLPETPDNNTSAVVDVPLPEPFSGEAEASSADKDVTPPLDTTDKVEPPDEQIIAPAAEESASQPAAEPAEVADDFWGAPSSKKKKKGKKGKKSGQSTPLTTEEQEPVKVEDAVVQDKDLAVSKESEVSDTQALDASQTDEAKPVGEDSVWGPEPSKKKKGKKGKKPDPLTEQVADEPVVETPSIAPESAIDQTPAPEASADSSPLDTVEATNVDEQNETEDLAASQSTKKKGKKNKKGAAAASASWDDLVADEATPVEPQAEALETAVDVSGPVDETPAPLPDIVGQEVAEPTPEPEVEDVWAALPSKKKGKKGKEAAKGNPDPVQDDPPQPSEAPPTEDAARSLDAEASEPGPSEPVEAVLEQQADIPTLEQETPAAEPEDFWARQPKGKKGKKVKKARQDAEEEPIVPAEASEVPSTEDVDAKLPAAEDTETLAPPTEAFDEPTAEAPKEAKDEDLWGAPTKGKKSKKGKKNKGAPEASETPQLEAVDAASEPQPSADNDLPTETPQEIAAVADETSALEPSTQPDAVPEDDWSSLTTSKKGKKAKKSKKAALADETPASEPSLNGPPAEGAKVKADLLDAVITGTEPTVEQDTVAVEALVLPSTNGQEASTEPITEQLGDSVAQAETAPTNEIVILNNTLEEPISDESAVIQDAETTPMPEIISADDPKDALAPEPTSDKDTAAVEIDTREAPAAEDVVDFEPLPTKKSKKDKKKNKKSQILDIDEPSNAAPLSIDDQIAVEEIAKAEEPSVEATSLILDVPQAEPDVTTAGEEPATQTENLASAEPEEDFGSFSTKKSKKDKKKGKKGKAAEAEDTPTPSSPHTGATADYFAGEPADSVPVIGETPMPAAETEGAAADYYAGDPDSDKTLSTETDKPNDKDLPGEQPAERKLAEEVSGFSTSAESKKDKKKAEKALTSSWDMPEESSDPVVDEVPPSAAVEEVQPVEAEPVDDFGSFSSKKSRKDKKKSKKVATDSWDATETDSAVPADAAIQPEPESKAADEPPPDASLDILNSVATPAADAPISNDSEPIKDPAVANLKTGDDVHANDDGEFSLSTKKSKKDKKKAKKSKGFSFEDVPEQTDMPAEFVADVEPAAKDESVTVGEPKPDLIAPMPEAAEEDPPTLPIDAQPTNETNATAAEVLPVPEDIDSAAQETASIDQQTAVSDAPRVDEDIKTDDFDVFSTKKSKKDKKKAKKGQSALSPWDEPEPSTPVDETPREISEVVEKPDETSNASEDAAPAVNAPEISSVLEAQEDPAPIIETPTAQEDVDFFSSSTTKKSKKDKKKAKKGQAASWDDTETVTPPVEAPVEAAEPAITVNTALEPRPTDLVPEETSNTAEAAPEQTPTKELALPQDETDDFGFSSTKKSKKDKKKAKKASQASPWDDEPTAAEPAIEQSSDKHDATESNDRSLAVDQDPVATEDSAPVDTSEPPPVSTETPADVDGEAFGSFSTKKSKKDKKKGKRAQEVDWPAEESAQLAPIDQEVTKADSEPNDNFVAQEADKAPDTSAAEPKVISQPEEADADDLWAAPAKKSKKDKKRGKRSQVEEEDVPTVDNEAPVEIPSSADDQQPPTGLETAEAPAPESTTPNAAETPLEEEDAWGSTSTKKSKKDKKKSKKAKASDEAVIEDQPAALVGADAATNPAAVDDTFRDENKTIDAQDVAGHPLAEASIKELEMPEPVPEMLDVTRSGDAGPMTAPGEPVMPEPSDVKTKNVDEAEPDQATEATESADPVISDKPAQDIDFAATLAAGLADSGFDPALVVEDPVFHRRASPPAGVAEADPEEIVTTLSKKKKGKGKKKLDQMVDEPAIADASTPAVSAPDDFDAALSQGLQDSGFDPLLLANASSPTNVDIKDDEDEFSFTNSNKKKKKGKKAMADAEDAPSSTAADPQEYEQQATVETSPDNVPVVETDAALDASTSRYAEPEDSLNPEPEQPTLDDAVVATGNEPIEAAEDELAAPSKSKKKSKKYKKQDRSIDFEDVAGTPTETFPESGTIEIAEAPTQTSADLNTVLEETAPSTEAAGEEDESMSTPLDIPTEPAVDDQSDPLFSTEQPKSAPLEVDSAMIEEVLPESTEQPAQAVDDEWAAPPKKKKGKKGKKQQDTELQSAEITEPAVETPAEAAPVDVETATEAALPAGEADTLVPDAEPTSTETALPADVEQSTAVADDEWGAPSKKKKKGKKGKSQQSFDVLDEEGPAPPTVEEVVPAIEPANAPAESTRDFTDVAEAVPYNTSAPVDTNPLVALPTDEPTTANLEPTLNLEEDEWAALSTKKKGKKGKKIQELEVMDEKSSAPESAEPSVPSEDVAVPEQQSGTPDNVAQDNTELAGTEPPAVVTVEQPPATSETVNDPRDAPSSKKDKKKKKKKGMEWSEPDETAQDTAQDASRALVEEPVIASVETPDDVGAAAGHVDEFTQPEPGAVARETPAVPDAIEPAVDDWAAPSKKKKGKKGKKNEDTWDEPETPTADAEPMVPETLVTDEPPASHSEGTTVPSIGTDLLIESVTKNVAVADQPTEPVAEPAEEEWGSSNKKKGKKNKKKLAFNDPDAESAPLDVSAEPVVLDSTPTTTGDSTENKEMPADESTSRALAFDDHPAPESPAPGDAIIDNWDLPIKKNKKKGKKNQLWAEEEPEATTSEPLPTTEPVPSFGVNVNDNAAPAELPGQPAERILDVQPQQDVTPATNATTEQPTTPVEEEQWGLPSKKKGKRNKKGTAADADLDPFISTPVESSAPISTADTAEVPAIEDAEPRALDTFQPAGDMDIDEMDKAYKAYKKNKRKQKKMQAVSGDDNEKTVDPLPEASEQQQSTNSDLGIPRIPHETEPVRKPSPLASEEPTWSFAKLEEAGDNGRGLTKMSSRGSLTSRRSQEPLRVDTTSPIAFDSDNTQAHKEPQSEAPESAHGRTAGKNTPLEPTSRQRASYLFQSPAPFQESTPNSGSQFRTPEHRGDASDYFHSRGVDPVKDESAGGPLSPSAGLMSPINALDPIPEEHAAHKRSIGDATNITPMEPAGKMLRRTETPKAIREKSLLSSASRDGMGSSARSVSNPISGFGIADEDRSLKRVVSDTRSPSAMSSRSGFSATQHVSPEDRRTLSRASNRSVTPTLRRTNLSGDLRAASRTSNRRGDSGSAVGARASPKTIPFEPPPTPPLNDDDDQGNPGATRAAGMAETFVSCDCFDDDNARADANNASQQGYGGGQVSQVSPTRPPSMRKRQSMHVMDLENKLEQLTEENRALQEAQQSRGLGDGSMDADNHGLQQALDARELELREKNNEIQHIQAMLEPMQQEITRLVQLNSGLTEANRNLVDDNNGRFATLQSDHANVTQQWQSTSRELETMRQEHSRLSNGMRDAVAAQLSTALAEKDHEIRKLKDELAEAADRIRALQVQIQSSKSSDFLNVRDEDYFDGACQKLCQHVQQWVLRFSKMSDNRICRLSSDLRDEKIEARLDNALLDGMDVDKLLGDRVRRRDVFMSVVMTMVWEYVFTRYLFGMDREQRQKLKALEKTLSEVGPPRAVAQWRATTLTLLAKRPTFSKQCALDTEAVAHEIFGVLSALLTPPAGSEQQLLSSLTKVITVAVNLSVEMRTQRAEYIMLPPLQPEYDTNGDLVRKVHFNASLMNERSGLFTSNEALEAERAIVKIVLFPLVVKKGDEYGEGEEEIVVCPAQVLVHNDSGKSRKVVRVMSGAMEIDDPRRSKQSLISRQGSMQF
ncbi:hypothetical protein Q7P35_008255 [Cladosporium inversicolor]